MMTDKYEESESYRFPIACYGVTAQREEFEKPWFLIRMHFLLIPRSLLRGVFIEMAKDNRCWGYDRIAGTLAELGYDISDQTVGNILKRWGLPPAPERQKTTTWQEFIRNHMDVWWAIDFFSAEVWTLGRLVTFDVLFLIKLDTPRGSHRRHHLPSQRAMDEASGSQSDDGGVGHLKVGAISDS
jgi:hypothetical protein